MQQQTNNPYELLYRNLNLPVNEHSSKKDAEEIARQLAYMHNAFGLIAMDLIKILSFKFPNQPTSYANEVEQQEFIDKACKDIQLKEKNQHTMQIQDCDEESPKGVNSAQADYILNKKRKKQVIVDISVDNFQRQKANSQNRLNTNSQPPNLQIQLNLAQEQKIHPLSQTNNPNCHSVILKQQISKIIQKVSSKRKEADQSSQRIMSERSFPQSTPILNQQTKCADINRISLEPAEQKNSLPAPERQDIEIPRESQQIYQNSNQHKPRRTTFCLENLMNSHWVEDQHFIAEEEQKIESQKMSIPNRLFSFFKQKPVPIVYQISDDE